MAEISLIGLAVFGFLFLGAMAIISNTGQTSINNINDSIEKISCPMPAFSGLWNSSGVLQYSGKTYNYPDKNNQTLTLTCTDLHTANDQDYDMGCPACVGWVVFIPDWVSSLGDKLIGIGTLVSYFVTPLNFNILGYTLADLSGIALMLVIMIYVVSYVFIGIWIWKSISPFSGAS